MRTTLKIVLPLIVSVVLVSLLFAAYQVRTQKKQARNEISRRAEILAESLQENVEPLFDRPLPDKSLQRLVDRFGQREHLKGIVVYNANGVVLAATSGLSPYFHSRPATATHAALRDSGLRLDQEKRSQFESRYIQERRKIEQGLRQQIETERQKEIPALIQQLRKEFQLEPGGGATAKPAELQKSGK